MGKNLKIAGWFYLVFLILIAVLFVAGDGYLPVLVAQGAGNWDISKPGFSDPQVAICLDAYGASWGSDDGFLYIQEPIPFSLWNWFKWATLLWAGILGISILLSLIVPEPDGANTSN